MPTSGVQTFKVVYGEKPPSVSVTFPRYGTESGETFTFYNYATAYFFVVQFMNAMHGAWKGIDRIGVNL